MARITNSAKTAKPTRKNQASKKVSEAQDAKAFHKRAFASFGAAMFGFAAAIPLTVALTLANVSQAATRVIQATPAATTLSCVQPTETAATTGGHGGQVLGDETWMPTPPAGGSGGNGGGNMPTPPANIVQQIVTGTISNTGPGSKNTVSSNITDTTTVTNVNNVSVNNSSSQTSSTGSANVSGNTTGGSAETGDAWNDNSSSFNFVINN